MERGIARCSCHVWEAHHLTLVLVVYYGGAIISRKFLDNNQTRKLMFQVTSGAEKVVAECVNLPSLPLFVSILNETPLSRPFKILTSVCKVANLGSRSQTHVLRSYFPPYLEMMQS
jgi:hypothetical protein